jgi:hypothetical protein
MACGFYPSSLVSCAFANLATRSELVSLTEVREIDAELQTLVRRMAALHGDYSTSLASMLKTTSTCMRHIAATDSWSVPEPSV